MEQIVEELKKIRRYIGIGVTAIIIAVLIQIGGSIFALKFVQPYKHLMERIENVGHHSDVLCSKATERLMAGDYAGVIKLTEEHEKKYPNDAYVFYYKGLAYQKMNDHTQALANLEKAQSLSPSWKENYTGPKIKKSRAALGLSVEP